MRTKKLPILICTILLLGGVALLAGCGSTSEYAHKSEPKLPVTVEEPEPEPEDEMIDDRPRNPLTGEPMEYDLEGQRPFAVVLDNIRPALPHMGISHADIIYELPVEGGITRMVAVFSDLSDVSEIGPVRSARHYQVDIAQGHDAIFIHAGGSPQAYSAIRNRPAAAIDGVMGSGREFYRDPERRRRAYEHSMMTSGELIWDNLHHYNFRQTHEDGFSQNFTFIEDGTPQGGQTANSVAVSFSAAKSTLFEFNNETNRYYVSQFGAPYIDGATEEQTAVINVLVLFAHFSVLDGEGRLGVEFNTGGEGYFINGGRAIPIRWSKDSYTSPFVYTLENGEPLELGIGRSFISIIQSGNDVLFE